jgi:glycosyltransferase involved in cell wall biosynthesis
MRACVDLADRQYPVIVNLIGGKSWTDEAIRGEIALARSRGVDVRVISTASDAQIRGLMQASVATVFVSWAEGYGLPVLESLACGVPVIVSDIEPLNDFAEYGGVVLVDPRDHIAIADAMLELIIDPSARDALVAGIASGAIPTSTDDWSAEVVDVMSVDASVHAADLTMG